MGRSLKLETKVFVIGILFLFLMGIVLRIQYLLITTMVDTKIAEMATEIYESHQNQSTILLQILKKQ